MLGLRNWPRCPAAYLRDPIWIQVARLHNAAKLAPLADWPDGWAAWCERYLLLLEAELTARAVSEADAARKRAEADGRWRAAKSH